MKTKHPYLRLLPSKLSLQDSIFHSNAMFCAAVLETEEDFCFIYQCSQIADCLNVSVVDSELSRSRLWKIPIY